MKEIIISENESGQRFDKFLFKYFKEAGSGFIYKMLRKKNIVLNDKKSDGKNKLEIGDIVKIYMTDDTVDKFRGNHTKQKIYKFDLDIVYEDKNIIVVNKPVGVLSQKSEQEDVSINEYIISYLLNKKSITEEELKTFKPSICNRLDRNTSGLILAGKSLIGLQGLSSMLKDRTMNKYYLAIVEGKVTGVTTINGYLLKNEKNNKVTISQREVQNSSLIETSYEPIMGNDNITLLKVKLITGKTHQIRAHLSSINHPIIGDYKYGNKKNNDQYKDKYNINSQMLHSWKMIFPRISGALNELSEKELVGDYPETFKKIIYNEINKKTIDL